MREHHRSRDNPRQRGRGFRSTQRGRSLEGAAPPVGGATVLSWANGALRRSQIHGAVDSAVMRAVLLPGAGDEAQMLILKQ